jgi:hypothetical protein
MYQYQNSLKTFESWDLCIVWGFGIWISLGFVVLVIFGFGEFGIWVVLVSDTFEF